MPQKSSSGRKDAAGPDSPIPPEWHWFLQALDQKLDSLRQQTTEMIERVHQDEMKQQQLEQGLQQQLHQHRLDLQELQQSLQYLSPKRPASALCMKPSARWPTSISPPAKN